MCWLLAWKWGSAHFSKLVETTAWCMLHNYASQSSFIHVHVLQVVTLDFDAFSTLVDSDYVYIYDGPTDLDPLIARLHGNHSVPQSGFTTTQRYMNVKFESRDRTRNNIGFNAVYRPTSSGTCDTSDPNCYLFPSVAGGSNQHYWIGWWRRRERSRIFGAEFHVIIELIRFDNWCGTRFEQDPSKTRFRRSNLYSGANGKLEERRCFRHFNIALFAC